LPNGQKKEWVFWDSQDSAMVVGETSNHKLVMIRQYRYLVGREVVEFASGGLNKAESPESGARREFEEETGYKCSQLIKLGSFYETYGQLNRRIHIFYAPNIEQSMQNPDSGDKGYEDIKVELMDFEQVVRMATENKIDAMGSTLAILLLQAYLKRSA
jgi:ADP-ribose pyrophosphatase